MKRIYKKKKLVEFYKLQYAFETHKPVDLKRLRRYYYVFLDDIFARGLDICHGLDEYYAMQGVSPWNNETSIY